MNNVLGVINLSINQPLLHELTYSRATATVPFGGRYRLIDFVLSNMVNSGINNVAVLAHNNYRSIIDHLGSGKEWDLDRKQKGLYILPPNNTHFPGFNGDLQNFYGSLDYFARSTEEYVVVSSSHMICNINFAEVVEFHQKRNADITIIYKEMNTSEENLANLIMVEQNDDGRVTNMTENHLKHDSSKVYMRTIVIKKELLVDLVKKSVAQNYYDLVRHVIMRNLDALNVYAFEYKGHLAVINSIHNYYKFSMDLLKPEVYESLFFEPGPIYTKIKDEPPTKYTRDIQAANSLIANGCIIEGTVENSILFRGVKVAKGAVVKNSILMQNCVIEEEAFLEHVILDKEVYVTQGSRLIGEQTAPTVFTKKSRI
ncbi:glucose-1-phosphate adenylyltransferase subunit GlgD [Paenibacillus sp. Soil522]|uniref:glucose-1-phosphate adenylyltransferase subunit GlgD n=1 Tax=Paenibacillus sp. Soil522 TaxID=1736388 RepID=UPI000700D70F|nr:glucose-1-phosphate adenylyltransferase subunit GlgD [Paenibacillus sp. Soil522]KRE46729.1 glucose-1-phosphate adenylyltransferase [Paenibacillus sp. Soil522]